MSKTRKILRILAKTYPEPETALTHESPFQLLVATILSAQCTDQRVNIITEKLFADYPTVWKMVTLPLPELEKYIRSAGLWQTKASNIKKTCQRLIEEHNGEVPADQRALMALPGVGRKTANVILANAFQIPAIAVDTHVLRVANRLGLANSKSPDHTEEQLMKIIPKKDWADAHHWLIFHGRKICKARKPLCHACPLRDLCPSSTALETDPQEE